MRSVEVPGEARKMRFEGWFSKYADAILRICFIYLRDASQAQDAMQDTFLKAWRAMEQCPAEAGERAWLMRIAINTCHDYHRSKWFRHIDMRRSLEEMPQHVTAVLPEDHALLMEVCALPEKYKQVLLLYYYQEMTLAEVAESLAISLSMVHKRLVKARELLKGRLMGRDDDE